MSWHDRALVAMAAALVAVLALIVFSDHPKPAPEQTSCTTFHMQVTLEDGTKGDVVSRCP